MAYDTPGAVPAAPGGGIKGKAKSLPGGPTVISGGTHWIQNPPFTSSLYNDIRLPSGKNFLRGCLETYQIPTGTQHDRYRLNFLYNPSTISVSHSVDTSLIPPDFKTDFLASPQVIGTVSGNLTFSLLFDRSYETWNNPTSTAGQYGAYSDVRALYRMFKMVPDADQVGTELMNGYMNVTPVTVYFGGVTSPGSLAYFGFVTDMAVDYTHWTHQMIPSRCVVNLGMQLYPSPTAYTEYELQPGGGAPPSATGTAAATKPAGSDASKTTSKTPPRATAGGQTQRTRGAAGTFRSP